VHDKLTALRVVKKEKAYSVRVKNSRCKEATGGRTKRSFAVASKQAKAIKREAFTGLLALPALGHVVWLALRSSKPPPKAQAWSCCWASQTLADISAIALNKVLVAIDVSPSLLLHNAWAYEQKSVR
jgi:hypothetical protein